MRCVSGRHRKKGPRATTPLFANPWSSERSGEIGTVGVGFSSPLAMRFSFACGFLSSNVRERNRHAILSASARTLKVIEENANIRRVTIALIIGIK